MAKYIDADKAKNGIMKFVNEYGEIVGMFVNDFNILLERCAVDVQEVRHGRWKRNDSWAWRVYACTACGDVCEVLTEWGKPLYEFCPYCGAKMDEVANENPKHQ